MPAWAFEPVEPGDFEALLALRIRAMRPSLEALGRFDPDRARERFAAIFAPQFMQHLRVQGQRAGCITLRPKPGALRIDHLYIDPAFQRQGLGAEVMAWAQAMADLRQLPLELAVLQGSDALRFYRRHGFEETGRSEFDIELRRLPAMNPVQVVQQLWDRFEAREWARARELLHDDAVVTWWASGERLEGADAFIRANAEYPGGWQIQLQQIAPLMDGRVLSVVRVDQPPARFFASSLFRVRDGRIAGAEEWWATFEEPPAWRQGGRLAGCVRFDAAATPGLA